jgi:predicted secreted protein
MGAVLLLALALAACGGSSTTDTGTGSASPSPQASGSPAAADSTTIVPSSDLPQVVHAKVGDTINVTLHSNASTGYQWTAQDLNDVAVLKQVGEPKIIAPKKKLAGAPGHTQFSFLVEQEGVGEIGFWYQPPGGGEAGATWALIVKAAKGHIPVDIDAGEDFTAETTEMRTGDTLVVTIHHAANAGRHSWKMIAGSPQLRLAGQRFSGGTQTMTFSGAAAGSTTLVMVNRPGGDPPLQTYALPVVLKVPKAPVTYQMNHYDNNESFAVKAGDTIQVSLPDQPSTDFQWKFQKPNSRVLKQVGKPQFFANNSLMGSKGKMVWTFSVVGAGKVPLIANYQQVPAEAMPVKTWQVNIAAKPGFTPKTVGAATTYPADSVHVLPGDQVKLHLAASAGTWVVQGKSKQLVAKKPVKKGSKTVITFLAKNHGIATPVILAQAAGGYPAQAYAFSATVAKGKLPIAVNAAERHAVKPIVVSVGQTFDIALESNSASTGYTWTTANIVTEGVIEQAGDPTIMAPTTEQMGASGATLMHFKAIGAGSAELVLLYQPPGENRAPAAIYMTMVSVQ